MITHRHANTALKRKELPVFLFQDGSFVVTAWGKKLTYFFIFFCQKIPLQAQAVHWEAGSSWQMWCSLVLFSPGGESKESLQFVRMPWMISVYIWGTKTDTSARSSQGSGAKHSKKEDKAWSEGKLRHDGVRLCSFNSQPHPVWTLRPCCPKLLRGWFCPSERACGMISARVLVGLLLLLLFF